MTFVVTFMVGNYGKGALKLGSILAGICAGFFVAAVLGMVDFSAFATASWFAPPAFGAHRLVFDPAACAVVGVVAIVNAVQVMGEFAAVSSAALDTPATDSQISGGLIANGLVGMFSGFLGGIPTATFGQNVGIIAENKVVNRMVFTLAAAILLVAGLLPKCAAVLTSIPQPVIGGATIGVFATIGMNGVVMFSRHGLSQRDATLMGLSIAFGTGIERTAGALAGAGFPAWVDTVFGGSSIAVAALVAVVLNLVLPRQKLHPIYELRRNTDCLSLLGRQTVPISPQLFFGTHLCGGVVELCRQTRFFWKYASNARIVPIVLSAPAAPSPNREMP